MGRQASQNGFVRDLEGIYTASVATTHVDSETKEVPKFHPGSTVSLLAQGSGFPSNEQCWAIEWGPRCAQPPSAKGLRQGSKSICPERLRRNDRVCVQDTFYVHRDEVTYVERFHCRLKEGTTTVRMTQGNVDADKTSLYPEVRKKKEHV